ncbi:MAG: helix-turn-helix transcriptional regulator [Candidatus Omnitrophota bacterium]
MSDLKKHIKQRKQKENGFIFDYDQGYEGFNVGDMLRQARETAGLSQEELAGRIKTQKTAISRIENHAGDIKFSTLGKVASALGKKIKITIE